MESFSYKDQCPDLVLGHSGIANLVASFRIMCYGCHSQIVTEMSLETAQLHSKNLFFCFKCRPSTGAEVLSDRYCKVLVFTSLPTSRSEFAAKKGRLHNKPVRLTSSGDEDIAVTNKPIPNQQPANSNELMYRSFTNLYLLPTSTRLTVRPANHSRLYESTTQEGDRKLSSLANSWELNETIDKLKSIPVDPSYKLKSDYRCLYCDKTFVYKAYWKHHEEKFMCRKANTCKICGKIYAHRSSLSRHRLVHTVDATNK
uniref:zinc finger protein 684-like n=1 Tax=Ciona intestinalis TaxID=7719 RepID=UPI000180D060|nr:zinc finger protein 684-like [Ciona intestinalis]|eukprot:XP_026689434.1 zinc finger protein 684-like [Ciona intestinalis]